MKKHQTVIVVLGVLAAVSLSLAQTDKGRTAQSAGKSEQAHVKVMPNEVKWGPGPAALPPGAQLAVLEGDPSKAGALFTIRAKLPDGYTVPPHWHPTDENVTVLEGALLMGLGEKLDRAAAHEMTVGAYTRMPKGTRHFAIAKGETIIQVHAIGPFEVNYVNPADDPRKQAKR
ncbi:MAG TPA: cupin domain-containing protein [Blastocatellia bacterium]|nr:cupin domain-containing protein [Blastocatellia bacterium]